MVAERRQRDKDREGQDNDQRPDHPFGRAELDQTDANGRARKATAIAVRRRRLRSTIRIVTPAGMRR